MLSMRAWAKAVLHVVLTITVAAHAETSKKVTWVPSDQPVLRIAVKFKYETPHTQKLGIASHRMNALASAAGMKLKYQRAMSGLAHVIEFDRPLSAQDAKALAVRIAQDPSVEYAQPDIWVKPALTPNDSLYAQQWHYFAPSGGQRGGANLPSAWDRSRGANIVVAVIDTGIVSHADLSGNIIGGYDFVTDLTTANDGNGRDADPTDPGDLCPTDMSPANSWHGTHVAGTIAAITNNASGVAGVAYEARILNSRALGRCGGSLIDIADAITWSAGGTVAGVPANANPAKVINLSLGGSSTTCPAYAQAAIDYAISQGAVVVAATGNNGAITTGIAPANCTGVIAVTAHTYEGDNANYANVGALVSMSAPGGTSGINQCTTLSGCLAYPILSTLNAGSYATKVGTSMATPHVAGAAAIILSASPLLTPSQVKSLLETNARVHPAATYCTTTGAGNCGAGMLDVANVMNSLPVPVVTATSNPTSLVENGVSVSLNCAAQEQDASVGTYTYQWLKASGPAITINNSNMANASFIAPSPGGLITLRCNATSSSGVSSGLRGSGLVAIRSNTKPTITTLSYIGFSGQPLSFNLAVSDADGDSLTTTENTLTTSPLALPIGATLSSAGVLNWPNPILGTYSFDVIVADPYSATSPITITLNIINPPVTASSNGAGGGGGGSVGWLGFLFLLVGLRYSRRYSDF